MIQVSKPSITDLERKYINEAIDCSDIGIGDFTPRFEKAWADYNSKEYGVSCSSGTNALFLALKALGIGKGDEVIVPEFTMIATAWAVSYTGATPVFVDCLDDLTADPNDIREKITDNTKAIMVVPIYGRPVCDSIYSLGIPIIEDMAEAHGIQPKGLISCYSFYGNKILTTGEGGMCLTNVKDLADKIRYYSNMCFDKSRSMIHQDIGFNFRMTNIQSAIGLAQVERADELIAKREQVAKLYDLYLPEKCLMPKREVVWVYDIKCDQRLKKYLYDNDIDSRYFFKPMSEQPMYLGEYEHLEAYRWSRQGLYLPCYPDLKKDDIIKICDTIKSFTLQ